MRLPWKRQIRRDRLPRPPHVEVEVRYRLLDESEALAVLRRAGIRFGKPSRQDDQAYGPEWWDYSQSRIDVTFARLRTVDASHLFTVKRPVTDVRTCIEHECFVSDREAMHSAIRLMGFRETIQIVKTRALAQHGPLTLCLDDVEGLGRFLEVERIANADDDAETARQQIESFVARLGIRVERCHDTYDSLLHARGLVGAAAEASAATTVAA